MLHTLQTIFHLCIHKKYLAKPHSQISIYSASVVPKQEAEILVQPAARKPNTYWRCPTSSVQFFFYIGGWNSAITWKKPSSWRCPTNSYGTGVQCRCSSLNRAGITLHGGKQVPENVKGVFLGQGITLRLLFLYRELEFHHSQEEAKYLELSNQFLWDRELQCSCCFYTGNWNSTTA